MVLSFLSQGRKLEWPRSPQSEGSPSHKSDCHGLNHVSHRISHGVTLLGNRVIEDAVSFAGVTLEESKSIILRDCHCQLGFRVTKETHPWVCLWGCHWRGLAENGQHRGLRLKKKREASQGLSLSASRLQCDKLHPCPPHHGWLGPLTRSQNTPFFPLADVIGC